MTVFEAHEIEDLRHFAMDVIRDAGEEALKFYGKGKLTLKFDQDLVTNAELKLSQLFQDRLYDRFPEHRIFKNTQDDSQYSHEEKRYLWVFDAIDGVSNFQAGIPIWGVSISLLENYWPVFGLFYMPATGDLFHALAGQKAYRGDRELLVSTQTDINDESVLLIYSRFHNHYLSTFPGKVRNLGCTVAHICYVASGRAEAAVIGRETYQDLATARIIIEAAGGKIYKMDGSDFFLNEYLNGERIDEHLIAVAPNICLQVCNYLRERSQS